MYLPPIAYPLLGPLAWLPFLGSATLPTGDWSRIIFHFITPNTPRRRRSEARTKVQHSWLVKCCNMWHNTSFNSEIPFIYFLYFFSLLRNTSRRACAMFFPLFMFPFYILFGLYCWRLLLLTMLTTPPPDQINRQLYQNIHQCFRFLWIICMIRNAFGHRIPMQSK